MLSEEQTVTWVSPMVGGWVAPPQTVVSPGPTRAGAAVPTAPVAATRTGCQAPTVARVPSASMSETALTDSAPPNAPRFAQTTALPTGGAAVAAA